MDDKRADDRGEKHGAKQTAVQVFQNFLEDEEAATAASSAH